MIAALSGALDSAFQRLLIEPKFLPRHVESRVKWLESVHSQVQALSDEELFDVGQAPDMVVLREGRYRGHQTQTLSWPMPALRAREILGLGPHTLRPHATLIGRGDRPLWLLVHGWLGGSRFMDEVFWPLEQLVERYDLALFMLPGHGRRKLPQSGPLPTFPSRNPVRNLLGLLTAITESAQLLQWLRRRGYERIGVAGSSLGVQVTALLASLPVEGSRWFFDRPLVDMSAPLQRRVQRDRPEFARLLCALQGIYRPVSPLHRPARVKPSQVEVLLGREDRVVGPDAGEILAAHFGVTPRSFPTGHVLSLGRKARVLESLSRLV